ncbi:MAG: DUF3850 domain-containing protein [Clostridia bacterium]|nr:DUF3850 domain-containing protein [Clostridia bacterium]MBR5006447.1 DUF3850 domain-containing protein [Clostridia bacterium]
MDVLNEKTADSAVARTVTIHSMKLAPEPFKLIDSGEKTVEMRLYDEKRRSVMPGDIIRFTNIEDGRTLFVRVKEICVFPSFEKLYGYFDHAELGYGGENKNTASPEDMYVYYTRENEKKYGAAGIRIEKI